MDPGGVLGLIDDPAVAEVAAEARARLVRVVASVDAALSGRARWRERQVGGRHAGRRRDAVRRHGRQRAHDRARRRRGQRRAAALRAGRRGAGRLHGDGRDLDPAQEAPGGVPLRDPGQRRSRATITPMPSRGSTSSTWWTAMPWIRRRSGARSSCRRRSYCSVGSTLASGAVELHHAYLLREPDGDERYAEVLVIGPDVSPDAAGGGRLIPVMPARPSGVGGRLDHDPRDPQPLRQHAGLVSREPWTRERAVGLEEARVAVGVRGGVRVADAIPTRRSSG